MAFHPISDNINAWKLAYKRFKISIDIKDSKHQIKSESNIPKKIPKQAREISAFFSLLVDETMKTMPDTLTPTYLRCFRKGCTGTISSSVDLDENKLFWECSECKYSGTLIGF